MSSVFDDFNIRYKDIRELRIFLLDAKGVTIAELTGDSYNKQRKIVFNGLNEFNFTIPCKVDIQHKIVKNPNIKKLKGRNKIRLIIYDENHETIKKEEYIIVNKIKVYDESTEELNIECKSSAYELSRNYMFDYKPISYNCTALLKDCLKDTNWEIGYINPDFDKMYRSFEISSKTKLAFLDDIITTFDAVVDYDTNNQKVNLYKYEEVSLNKGFRLKYAQYINSLNESEDEDEITTRLYVRGKDGLTIHGINPTGQSYIDNFSYYYEVMSSELKAALLLYNTKLIEHSGNLSELLGEKKVLQESLTKHNSELLVMGNEKQIILDNIEITKRGGKDTSELTKELNSKLSEIKLKETSIESINQFIKGLDSTITNITSSLSYDNNISSALIKELIAYISVDEWSDDNITDEEDLYTEGKKYLEENSKPKISISTNILNFFEVPSEWHNWDRFDVGDIVSIVVDPIGTNVKARIQELNINYDSFTIDVVVTNINSVVMKNEDEIIGSFLINTENTNKIYKSNKPTIETASRNFNARNDRIPTKPASPTFKYDDSDITYRYNDNGSVDITVTWQYPNYEETNNDAHNIDGFELFLYTDTTSDTHVFGSNLAAYDKNTVSYQSRTYSFTGKVSNKWYTMGIRAYREVDPDINPARIIYSEIVSFPETPYRPSDEAAMIGTLNGVGYYSGDASPENPKIGDEWTDTSKEMPIKKKYSGTKWIEMGTSNAAIINPTTLNIKDYGAIGDGIVDDTPAFQNAIKESSDRGIPLFIPKGNYFIKGVVNLFSNVTINMSDDAWLIKKVGASTNKLFRVLSGTSKGYGSGARNIIISGGNVKGDLDNNISIDNSFHHVSDLIIRNVNIEHAVYRGHFADLMGCENVLIENCTFKGFKLSDDRSYTECIQIDNSSYVSAGGSDNVLSYDGLPTHDVIIRDCEFLPILNDDGTIKYYAPNITGSHGQIRGLPPYNLTVDNNVIKGGAPLYGSAQAGAGWVHYRGGYNITIKNNKFVNMFSNVSKPINVYMSAYAYELSGVADPNATSSVGIPNNCYNIRVENNTFDGFDFADMSSVCQYNGVVHNEVIYKITDLYIQSNTYKNCFNLSQIGQRVSGDLNYLSYISRLTMKQNGVDSARRLAYMNYVDNFSVTDNPINKAYYVPLSINNSTSGSVNNNQIDNSISAILVNGDCRNININGNQISNPLPTGIVYDSVLIDIRGTASNCNVSNNTLDGDNKIDIGIRALSTTKVGFVKDNIIQDIATKVNVENGSGMIATNNI